MVRAREHGVSRVVDGEAMIAATSASTSTAMAGSPCWPSRASAERRLGRIVQRLLEIETYKCMAMLTLPQARMVARPWRGSTAN